MPSIHLLNKATSPLQPEEIPPGSGIWESAKHREAEKRNRRLQIELATIEPYLEKLNHPDEMRVILKDKANSYFMGQVPREPDDDMEARISGKEWKRREE